VKLHDKNIKVVKNTGKAAKTITKVFNYLGGCPIIDITKTSEELGLSFNAVSSAVKKLIQLGILKQTENVQRNRVFAYEEYLSILRKGS
jgi:DNA-binding Lrp family transcriptional regulator